jgi:hypothetical protein
MLRSQMQRERAGDRRLADAAFPNDKCQPGHVRDCRSNQNSH